MSEHGLASFCTNSTGGMSRLWCSKCEEETPHKHGACTRTGCGTRHAAYPVRDFAGQWVAKSMTIKRWNGARRK